MYADEEWRAAVLVLVDCAADPSVVLTRRALTLRSQPGQISFPGGMREAGESAVQTALREANEEIALDPAWVEIVGELEPARAGTRTLAIVPVLGRWDGVGEVMPSDSEVAEIYRVPLSVLADPARRFMALRDGVQIGPAFIVDGLVIWGFTARVLDWVVRDYGAEQPWDHSDWREVPAEFRR
ncbi:8-oxo-dGTP pyrophosphatase MutT (NUDIX family) [Arcanobacterium wilhelmae]|uniref:8-oxo-dGTP pyrophosphatase MutT (NUDIX family) n=1 Tax=Arcanobacterium wilhelmae TaxID=1803177 RepID=A0ABT9NAF6_9ACTO|nr:CoA pyrophosphatase [Arcanobacterium wilhelmae]MDP9800705.1 8-oxo-dGTP pyrophosphatase MutT (NUDIX family) [Arcanobacterium wilhelmae]WFN90104.1 CoA pyrophosphatase [Arcanobacterium wilhelmae]